MPKDRLDVVSVPRFHPLLTKGKRIKVHGGTVTTPAPAAHIFLRLSHSAWLLQSRRGFPTGLLPRPPQAMAREGYGSLGAVEIGAVQL
jgi:hypothetical protein